MAFCIKCGSELVEGSKFCVKCGQPVAAQPVAEAPVVEEPVAETPVVEEPVAEAPVVEEPVAETPVVEEPVAEAPVVEEPVAEAPVVEEPVVEAPVVEEPVAEAPVVEAPVAEAPVVEAPVAEAPVVEEPVVVAPVMEQPVPPMQPVMEQSVPPMQTMMGQSVPPVQPVMGPLDQPPKKRKNVKAIVAICSAALIAVAAIVVAIILIVSGGTDSVDLKKYVTVEYDGYDTVGSAYVSFDKTELLYGILEAQGYDIKSLKPSDVSLSLQSLISNMDIEVSNTESLSNGDEISVKVIFNEQLMEENDLEFENTEIKLKVSELEALTEVDPFEDLTVVYGGTAPNGYAYYENDSSIDCVDYTSFYFDKEEDLSNGDVLTLTVDEYDAEYAATQGYKYTITSKEYTVEGLPYYIQSLDEITDEQMDVLKEVALSEIEDTYNWMTSYATLSDINYVGSYFAKYADDEDYSENMVIVIYSATTTSPDGEYNPTQIYLPVEVSYLRVNEEGELESQYGYLLGDIEVEGHYYTLDGYATGYDFYVDNIEGNDEYEFEATDDMPDFSVAPEQPTDAPVDAPVDGTTETPSDVPAENGDASVEGN